MKTALWEVQTAIYSRLANDANLMGKINGVFDEVPEGTPLPYIALGDDTVSDFGSKTFEGEYITHTLHVFSDYHGKKEAKDILNTALQAITVLPFEAGTNFRVEDVTREMLEVFEDSGVYHGVMRLRFRVYHN